MGGTLRLLDPPLPLADVVARAVRDAGKDLVANDAIVEGNVTASVMSNVNSGITGSADGSSTRWSIIHEVPLLP